MYVIYVVYMCVDVFKMWVVDRDCVIPQPTLPLIPTITSSLCVCVYLLPPIAVYLALHQLAYIPYGPCFNCPEL